MISSRFQYFLNTQDRINNANCERYGNNAYINAVAGVNQNWQFAWRIGCSIYKQKSSSCEHKYTDYNDYGAWNENIYLDRQRIMCSGNSLLKVGYALLNCSHNPN